MATFQEANNLLNKVAQDARPAALREEAQVTAFARNATGNASLVLQWWDKSFWAERQKEALFGVRQEELREFLPLDSVVQGLFKVRCLILVCILCCRWCFRGRKRAGRIAALAVFAQPVGFAKQRCCR
jgi:hypothetical protein